MTVEYASSITVDSLRQLIEEAAGEAVDIRKFETQDRRLYSQIHRLDAWVGGEFRRFVVKSWASVKAFDTQTRALEEARAVFDDDPAMCIPFIGKDRQARVIVMEYIDDDTLAALIRFEFSRDHLNLPGWCHRLESACFSTGRWLRRWHDAHTDMARLDVLLGEYLHARPEYLELLDPSTRETLVRLVAGLGSGLVAAAHCDFTPLNVLWAPERLTVLDFGVSEWHRMAPAWDHATMKIGLLGELRFATRSPARWVKGFADNPVAAFERGYGSMHSDIAVVSACSAIRHLILYGSSHQAGKAHKKKAAWHRAALQRVISF